MSAREAVGPGEPQRPQPEVPPRTPSPGQEPPDGPVVPPGPEAPPIRQPLPPEPVDPRA
jgi:hypothetical protein